jgi:type I restriction enzyme, S subunit
LISQLKSYPTVKDSGLAWLGMIPSHWSVKRGKVLFQCIDVRSERGEEELLTVSAERGVVPRSSATVTMFKAESYKGYKLCWPGDLVINSLWAWGRGLGVSHHHGIVSSAYGVYRLRQPYAGHGPYIHALVRSVPFNWELHVRSKGIWISRLQLTDDAFLGAPFPVPPLNEAAAIVRFLDHADRRIRRYIRAKQKLIKLLEEQKHAIIHRAVTRGLDSNVRLKCSGLQWLGELPAHWSVLALRRLTAFVTSGSRGWAEYYSDDGDLFVQSGNLGRSMSLDFSYTQHVRPPQGAEGERTRVRRGDILICITGALTGNVVIVDSDLPRPAYVNQHVALVRVKPGSIDSRFLAYVLHSELGRIQFKTSEYGGTKQGLGLDDIKSAIVPVPPVKEQVTICADLDDKLRLTIWTSAALNREIASIREFGTRLTADVVTGKLDVRDAAACLAEDVAEVEPQDESADEVDESEDALPEEAEV